MSGLLRAASRNGYAVGAFEVWSLESVRAVVRAAEQLRSPVILQVGPLEAKFAGLRALSRAALDAIDSSPAPAALHLDHGDSFELAAEAIECGFQSVMIDMSHLPFEENVAETRRVAEYAHERGVEAEGELGRLVGAEAGRSVEEWESAQTDPDKAAEFVERTRVDALAVAIGNAHGFYVGPPRLNLARLEQIRRRVRVPLVLHGGSGIPERTLFAAIARGISKINICTEFVAAFLETFRSFADEPPAKVDVPHVFGPPRERAAELVAEKLRLFRSVGQAANHSPA